MKPVFLKRRLMYEGVTTKALSLAMGFTLICSTAAAGQFGGVLRADGGRARAVKTDSMNVDMVKKDEIIGAWVLKGTKDTGYIFRSNEWLLPGMSSGNGGQWRVQKDTLVLDPITTARGNVPSLSGLTIAGRPKLVFPPLIIVREAGKIMLRQGEDFNAKVFQRVDTLKTSEQSPPK